MRYFIGFLITIGLIILLVLLLFRGGGNNKVPTPSKPLVSYADTDAQVRLTIDGPINVAQTHQQIRITVGKDETTFEHLQGYDGSVVSLASYASSKNAYDVFLHALLHASFTKGNTATALSDERGYCPLGNRYIFEIVQNGKDQERFWATSCGKPKTYLGNVNLTLQLFKAQVPDYSTMTENIQL